MGTVGFALVMGRTLRFKGHLQRSMRQYLSEHGWGDAKRLYRAGVLRW